MNGATTSQMEAIGSARASLACCGLIQLQGSRMAPIDPLNAAAVAVANTYNELSSIKPAPDLTAVKAMLVDALRTHGAYCRFSVAETPDRNDRDEKAYAAVHGWDDPRTEISLKGEIDTDKLAATVAEWFASRTAN